MLNLACILSSFLASFSWGACAVIDATKGNNHDLGLHILLAVAFLLLALHNVADRVRGIR